MKAKLDLNFPAFQKEWFALSKADFVATKNALKKIMLLNWDQIYSDRGLNWEKIHSKTTPEGRVLFSIRLSKKFRAVVCREKNFMVFISLHPGHDTAYRI